MKKLLVAAILSSASVGAFAYDAQVNFSGEVLDQTCEVNGTTKPAVLAVTLPTVNKDSLVGTDSWTGNTPFTFNLTNCPVQLTKAKWEITGQVDSAGTLTNTIAGGTNATVRLIDPANNYININTDAGYSFTPAADGSATLKYMAQYYSQAGSATPGKLSTVGYWTLTY